MTILFATSLYWLRLVRLPIHIRLKQRYVGSSAMFIIGFGLVELWAANVPRTSPMFTPSVRCRVYWQSIC
jgi:hypothetical protein